MTTGRRTELELVAISRWIDAANAHRHPDTNLWSRVSKAAEEGGEAMDALRGLLGENPRKQSTSTMDDVIGELLDAAIAALGAVEHMTGHQGGSFDLLARKIHAVHQRAELEPVGSPLADRWGLCAGCALPPQPGCLSSAGGDPCCADCSHPAVPS